MISDNPSIAQPIQVVLFAPAAAPVMAGETGTHGGAEVDVRNIAAALSGKNDFSVTVVCLANRPNFLAPTKATGASQPIPVLCLPAPPQGGSSAHPWILRLRILWHYIRLYWALRNLTFDVLVTKPAQVETGLALWAAEHGGAAGIYRIAHDWETDITTLTHPVFRGNRHLANWFVSRLKKARAVMAQTQIQKRALLQNLGVIAEVIPNSHLFSEQDLQSQGDPKTVLWAGRIHPMKNPSAFLALAGSLPDFSFRMLTMKNPGYEEDFETSKAAGRELANLTWVENTPSGTMAHEYAQAALFVLTSDSEGFPNVIIEAMRAGLPIVTLNVNPDNILTDSWEGLTGDEPPPGFCANGDFQKMKHVVEQLLADRQLWVRVSQAARHYAFDNHNAASNAVRFAKLLSMLARKERLDP